MQSGLTPFDLTALRFLVASALIFPFAIAWWPRHLPLHATLSMSVFGPGALYTVLMYFGLKDLSAAYGGVFANGTLPIFTILLGFFFAQRCRPAATHGSSHPGCRRSAYWRSGPAHRRQRRGVGHCVLPRGVGCAFDLFFRRKALASRSAPGAGPGQPSERGTFPAGLVFLSSLHHPRCAVVHGTASGRLPGLGPWLPGGHPVLHFCSIFGPMPSAGLAASVPASATLLAIPVLGEISTGIEWVGIAIVTAGLVLLLRGQPETRSLSK